METSSIEKLYAKKRQRRKYFLRSLTQYSLAAFVLGLCASNCLASILSYIKTQIAGPFPEAGSFVFGPKCLFLVCNMIVIFLVGESKLGVSSSNMDAAASPMYEEYFKHARTMGLCRSAQRKRGKTLQVEEKTTKREERKSYAGYCGSGGEDREDELPVDELNKRVEDFIARVNHQRRMEAERLVLSSG